jgi:hypothetical protein
VGAYLLRDYPYANENRSEEREEDEQAPAGTQAVFSNEYLAESRWLRA